MIGSTELGHHSLLSQQSIGNGKVNKPISRKFMNFSHPDKNYIFENLKQLAETMVKTFGHNIEVAIHDFSSQEELSHSLVYIAGSVTNRKPGAPITNLVARALKRHGDTAENVCNYKTMTKEGKILKSSTNFIRNEQGKIIGAFCINYDITDLLNAENVLKEFTSTLSKSNSYEKFSFSPKETIDSLADETVGRFGKQPKYMSREEKVKFIEELDQAGVFLIKGAEEYVAQLTGSSKYTIYNYLRESRRREELDLNE